MSIPTGLSNGQTTVVNGIVYTYSTVTNSLTRIGAAASTSTFTVPTATASTSPTTGAFVVTGGAGIGGAINVGGSASHSGSNTSASFIPTSSSAPTNGMYLPSTNTLGWSSNSLNGGMQYYAYNINNTGINSYQLSLGGNGVDTNNISNLYVYKLSYSTTSTSSSTGLLSVYTSNGNIPFGVGGLFQATSPYYASGGATLQTCPIALAAVSTAPGYTVTQFPSGVYQTFPCIGIYAENNGQVGNQSGTSFFAQVNPYYNNSTGYYAHQNPSITSGQSYGFRADIGPHAFSSQNTGFNSRFVSGQSGSYTGLVGWLHIDETGNSSGQYAALFQKSGSTVGSITLTTSATAFNTSSDPRLKNIAGPITAEDANAFIMALQPKKGTWKADGTNFQGFLSTEYQTVDPQAVVGDAGATEIVGDITDQDGKVVHSGVVQPPADLMQPGTVWTQTGIKDIYQHMEYGSAAWCANMTAFVQNLQNTIATMQAQIADLQSK